VGKISPPLYPDGGHRNPCHKEKRAATFEGSTFFGQGLAVGLGLVTGRQGIRGNSDCIDQKSIFTSLEEAVR